jgi:4-carboxymuconolactone decarboxylase
MSRGLELLKRIGGLGFDGPVSQLAALSPDMARLTVEHPYGEILSRTGLDLRTRQICTVATLMAQGSMQPQLRFHMEGLLNVDGSIDDLVDLLLLATATLGFPVAIDAIAIVRAIVADRNITYAPAPAADDEGVDRVGRGREALAALFRADAAGRLEALERLSPDLARWTLEFAYGDVRTRLRLTPAETQLALISMLATTGNRTEALVAEMRAALGLEVPQHAIIEALIQLTVYAGYPVALNAFAAAREAFSAGAFSGPALQTASLASEPRSARAARGLENLTHTSGAAGAAVVHGFDDLAPQIGRMIVEHSYGDIFSRAGLDPKTRELTAIAALAGALNKASERPLTVHINAALDVGATREEVVETLLNVLPYRGYPAIERALALANATFADRSAAPTGRS